VLYNGISILTGVEIACYAIVATWLWKMQLYSYHIFVLNYKNDIHKHYKHHDVKIVSK